jgi:hypothetical protein
MTRIETGLVAALMDVDHVQGNSLPREVTITTSEEIETKIEIKEDPWAVLEEINKIALTNDLTGHLVPSNNKDRISSPDLNDDLPCWTLESWRSLISKRQMPSLRS